MRNKYENFDKLTIAMLNEFIEKILVHERDRKGSIQTTQEVEIYFNFVGRFVPPAFGEVELTPEELEEIRKREIKEKPKVAGTVREKAKNTPKELVRRGMEDGTERLRSQLRDTSQNGQQDEYGGDRIEDTAAGSLRRMERRAEKLIKGREQEQTAAHASEATEYGNTGTAPVIRTKVAEPVGNTEFQTQPRQHTAAVKVLRASATGATITAKYESDTTMGEQTTAAITVGKRVITVTADNKSMTVNGTLPTFTVTYGNLPSGVQAEDIFETLASASTTTDGKTTGSFDITVTTPVLKTEAEANYEVGAVTKGTLTVNSAYTGGGGGGVSTYAITLSSAKNGDVTSSHKSASKGTTVTLTVDPDKGYTLETITVTDKNGDELKLTEKNGKYTFTMPASKVTVKATFMEDNSMLNFFVDVPANAYYYDAVLWAAENGITGGVDATHFAPNATCTRAQAVTFLWRAAGSPAPKSSENPFTDVKTGSYYYDAVLWAVENGITNGTSATAFSPNATCSRAQIVTFLWRSQKSPAADTVNPFADVAADSYYANAVLWAAENGITGGTSATTFSPSNNCTRAQIVTFLFRCLGE